MTEQEALKIMAALKSGERFVGSNYYDGVRFQYYYNQKKGRFIYFTQYAYYDDRDTEDIYSDEDFKELLMSKYEFSYFDQLFQ